MIYAKWKLDFSADPRYGIGPDPIVVGRGDSIHGAFFEGDGNSHNFIYGYLNDGFDYSDLDAWQVTEVTQAEILEKAQALNPECYIGDDGKVTAPQPEQP
jgi:hypothetical protein